MFWQPVPSPQDDTARKLGLEVSNKHRRCKNIMILDYAMIHVQLRTSVDPWLPRGVHSTLDARRDQVNNLINVSVDFVTNASFANFLLLENEVDKQISKVVGANAFLVGTSIFWKILNQLTGIAAQVTIFYLLYIYIIYMSCIHMFSYIKKTHFTI